MCSNGGTGGPDEPFFFFGMADPSCPSQRVYLCWPNSVSCTRPAAEAGSKQQAVAAAAAGTTTTTRIVFRREHNRSKYHARTVQRWQRAMTVSVTTIFFNVERGQPVSNLPSTFRLTCPHPGNRYRRHTAHPNILDIRASELLRKREDSKRNHHMLEGIIACVPNRKRRATPICTKI